ncbi:MAG: metallophosphoesterase [Clostridia bacterium]
MKRLIATMLLFCLLPAYASGETIRFSADLHVGSHAPEESAIVEAMLALPPEEGVLLLLGDLTNSGRPEEHAALIAQLNSARARGATVYVLPGNHDMSVLSAQEFAALYADFGYAAAFSRDKTSLSYAVAAGNGLWLAMLDTCIYGEAGGMFRASTQQWLTALLQRAQAQGVRVIAAGHHPILPHSYREESRSDLTVRGEQLAALLRAYQVPVYLAGHRHIGHYAAEQRLTEILAGTPMLWPNKLGELTAAEGLRFTTRTLSVGQERFAEASWERLQTQAAEMAVGALEETPFAGDAQMIALFQTVYCAYRDGTLWRVRDACLADLAYSRWQDERIRSIFRPWMRYLLETMTEDYNLWVQERE